MIDQNSLYLDIPLRYYLKRSDNARVYRVLPHIEEVGIESLSIGMVAPNDASITWGDNDSNVSDSKEGYFEVMLNSYLSGLEQRSLSRFRLFDDHPQSCSELLDQRCEFNQTRCEQR